jgi:peptidoglycan hydrolase-like protein with peptidoglycan-binding domain
MRTTYWVPGARRRSFSLVAGLALLCLAGTMVAGSPARAAEPPTAKSELLTTGDGYGQPRGSKPVRVLQRRLRTLGLRPGPVDGLFGPQTRAAVERFQHVAGVHVDGIVGPKSRRALRRASAPMLGRGAGYDKAGGSVRVRVLQRHLRGLGLRPGPIDGLYGPRTAAAVARFQRDHGSRSDGVAWARTRRAIATARRAAETRLVHEDDATTGRSGASKPAPAAAREEGVRPAAANAQETSDGGSGGSGQSSELGLFVLGGLLALVLVTGALTLARKMAIAPTGAVRGGDATPSPHGLRMIQSGVPPSIAQAPDEGSSWGDDGDQPVEVAIAPTGAVRGGDATPSPHGLRMIPSGVPPSIAQDPDEGSSWGDDGDQPVEAVGYATTRDATRGQLDVRRQIRTMDALCERRGWRLAEVAHDVGDLPGTALDRPGLNYALERLKSGERDCLIVSELRRLGESATELGWVLTWLRDRGLRLVAVDVELDTAAADGSIAADALICVGERAERGQLRSRSDGDTGDRRPGRQAVRDLPELREHIVAMRSAGMTLQAIADRLNEEGVPTIRGGRKWRPSSVQVAAGYRRPRRPSRPGTTHDPSAERRRAEDR